MSSSTKKPRAPRSYRLGRRAESADETRRRIVEATFALHAEQGIAGTTMKQIAERAGVSVGTVYHHFPTYPEAIAACGAYATVRVPAPTEAVFSGAESRAERVRRLAQALFRYYEALPALASVRRDAHVAEVLQAHVAQEARTRMTLAAVALGDAPEPLRTVVSAMVDLDVFQSFQRQGRTAAQAADTVAAMLNAWLDAGAPTPTSQE